MKDVFPAHSTFTGRRHDTLTVACFLAALIINAGVSYAITIWQTRETVSFDMKRTVDAFFDSASHKNLSEEQSKALSQRFNTALEGSLRAFQREHHVLIMVSPAVVQGAPDITRDIQRDIARRMREGGRE
ncbi:type-F conjugative transfer system protein TrbI [Rahnella ecdela]|uniref:Type-F conjugative transfer system protein TrbI n=1 Tax=Rahnella ecdela TaxID=2816250 RepID=A0ABS6LCZ8_9GAMM|nr:type-F conjugative transfer system protein TrbI [Rahnella ecdela]MBU9844809.1 type-F conjugative transfer system protein TrbI [Rahnella ecdela]